MTARAARPLLVAAFVVSVPSFLFCQSSTSYRLPEHLFNAGGRPAQAVVSTSPSFKLSLDSIGEPVAGRSLTGVSYRVDGGVAQAYRPPGEVNGLEFLADQQTIAWDWEPASTTFNVYRGPLTTLPGAYGTCGLSHATDSSWSDATMPSPGTSLFYLVTGENRLGQEGTKGYTSAGAERPNPSPCP